MIADKAAHHPLTSASERERTPGGQQLDSSILDRCTYDSFSTTELHATTNHSGSLRPPAGSPIVVVVVDCMAPNGAVFSLALSGGPGGLGTATRAGV